MKNLDLTNNLSEFSPSHGVAIGTNPNQPETDKEIETVIKALRLFNVGEMDNAERVIADAKFSDDVKQWIKVELKSILVFLDRAG